MNINSLILINVVIKRNVILMYVFRIFHVLTIVKDAYMQYCISKNRIIIVFLTNDDNVLDSYDFQIYHIHFFTLERKIIFA